MLLGSLAGDRGLPGLIKAREQSRLLAAQLAALQADNAALRARVDDLRNDPAAIEAIARHDFGLARKDELVVTLAPASSVNP